MSDLTITTAGATQTAKSGTQLGSGKIIRITPTLDNGTAFAQHDVLCDSTEIPNAVRVKGGTSKLVRVEIHNHLDTTCDIDIVFTEKQANLGTKNSAVGSGSLWTETLAKAAGFLGVIKFDVSATECDLVNSLTSAWPNSQLNQPNTMLLQGAENSTSVYFAAIDRTGSLDFGNDDLEFVFHIEYLD